MDSHRWKQLDDLRIARTDDDNREHRGQRHEEAQKGVPVQLEERRLRAVAGRRQPVRAKAHPRQ